MILPNALGTSLNPDIKSNSDGGFPVGFNSMEVKNE